MVPGTRTYKHGSSRTPVDSSLRPGVGPGKLPSGTTHDQSPVERADEASGMLGNDEPTWTSLSEPHRTFNYTVLQLIRGGNYYRTASTQPHPP